MEFKFNLNDFFRENIVEIGPNLIPPGYSPADKRALWDTVTKVSEVVNSMGQASAAAQGLTKSITTSDRLRNSEQKVYLLIDKTANAGRGAVTGMLKTGKKGLYVFDRDGHHYQVQPACVLDFYVHESKQRMGLGKQLFEHMLEREKVEPVKLAIDRPSDKFLGFLNKHYALDNPVKQMNNFVVFDGFFPEPVGAKTEVSDAPTPKSNQQAANGLQTAFTPYGRYGAPRPPCSMGQIIHNQSPLSHQAQEPNGKAIDEENKHSPSIQEAQFEEQAPPLKLERPQSLSLQTSDEQDQIDGVIEEIIPEVKKVVIRESASPAKMATDEQPEKKKTPSHLTDQGYVDLKFYHNKLW